MTDRGGFVTRDVPEHILLRQLEGMKLFDAFQHALNTLRDIGLRDYAARIVEIQVAETRAKPPPPLKPGQRTWDDLAESPVALHDCVKSTLA